VLLLDKWERQTLADRQGLIARGVVDELPSLFEAQEQFDAALNAAPKRLEAVDSERMELLQAMGVA
jgi:hypothetical protein